jgi:hypothetical protein
MMKRPAENMQQQRPPLGMSRRGVLMSRLIVVGMLNGRELALVLVMVMSRLTKGLEV